MAAETATPTRLYLESMGSRLTFLHTNACHDVYRLLGIWTQCGLRVFQQPVRSSKTSWDHHSATGGRGPRRPPRLRRLPVRHGAAIVVNGSLPAL